MNTMLGDMLVIGEPPPKLWKALAVIAAELHPGFAAQPRFKPGASRESCVLCSLAVRDFLRAVGFVRAEVLPVCTVMWATEGGKDLHSLGMGHPDNWRAGVDRDKWPGHMVVSVLDHLIDTTLYNANRPVWPQLPGMIAAQRCERARAHWMGLDLIAGIALDDSDRPSYQFTVSWFDTPCRTNWRAGPDCERERRKSVVAAMVARFGQGG